MFVSFYYVIIIKYDSLKVVLSYILVNCLNIVFMFVMVVWEVIEEVFVVDLSILEVVVCDICVIVNCDLVVLMYLMLLFYLKGYYVL